MTTITLHGEMGRIFGRTWKLAVDTPAEALRAIEANHPGLAAYLGAAEERGIRFRIKVGKDQIRDPELVKFPSRGRKISISPVVQGAKSKYLGLIIGVALIALTWGAASSVALFGPGFQGAFTAGGAFGIKGLTYAAIVGGTGISMAVGGVAQMLSSAPKIDTDQGTQSFLFQGPVNVSAQGGPVPVCYGGPIVVGSIRISAGIKSEDRPGKTAGGDSNSGGYTGSGGYAGDGNTGEGPFSRFPAYI